MSEPALAHFLERLPWLAELHPERLEGLDRSDWHLPSEATVARLQPLGDALGVNLMFYRQGGRPPGTGLCRAIAAASLSQGDVDRILTAEGDSRGCVIVAYQRPIRVRDAIVPT
jgi:hypothetical protein